MLERFFRDDALSKDELVHLISRGYLKHEQLPTGERSTVEILWIKGKEAKDRILGIGNEVKGKYRSELERIKVPVAKAVMDSTPPHLRKTQAYGLQHIFHSDGWFIIHCLKNLVASGKLKLPNDDQKKSLTAVAVTGA